MSITSRWILPFALILAIHPSALAQSAAPPVAPPAWPVTSAPARFNVDPDQADAKALISWVNLYPPDPKWATMPMRVFTDTGTAVGSDVLWTAPGEPVTLVFDTSSGAKRYHVYMGSNWPAMHLPDRKAGVWLETRVGEGKSIDHLLDVIQAWNQSSTVVGRALTTGIFEGGNRFGPPGNVFLHLQGWFDAPAPEHLELALVSSDSTFVLVDGKEVVEWPGLHDFGPGLGGQHRGAVDLPAGLHMLDYYNVFVPSEGGGGPPILCCLVAKGGPLQSWTMLMGNNNFFRPIAHYHIADYELQPGGSASGNLSALAFTWTNRDQSVLGWDLPDLGLIALQLSCVAPFNGTPTWNWTFDDGSTAEGQNVVHLFPRPGMRKVQLTLKDGDKEIAILSQTISVHPEWANPNKQPELRDEQAADIMGRDPTSLSISDLTSCFAVFGNFRKLDGLLKLLPAVCAKMKDISDADLPHVKDAALLLVRDDWAHFAEESQLLRALIDRASTANPSPQLITVSSECWLRLAQLVLKTSDHTDDVRALIAAINVPSLTGEEPRMLNILQADLAFDTGDVAGAKKQYETLTGEPSGPDARSSIRRTAKIGQARAFLDRKDFDAAEDSLREVAWQAPIEKLSSDWALTRLRLYQEQNLTAAAYLWAKRLIPVINGSSRSELLFRLTDLAFAQGDKDLASKTLSELLKKHPYSAEAAQAKEKWPGAE
jgi:PKD repeat protein